VCAGQAIMHGKFVFRKSASTFLFLNRFSMLAFFVRVVTELQPF
jgi:hypothetical protein